MSATERQIALRQRPEGKHVMVQSWRSLTFLHWTCDVDAIQRTLPDGLSVDTFEGKAYVGLVPFTMCGICVRGMPPIPGTAAFHETNVRTYVVDVRGDPGVMFYSLDASSGLAVIAARAWYRLPYHKAAMRFEQGEGVARCSSARKWPGPVPARCEVESPFDETESFAEPGTLEFFLLERYALFTSSRGRILCGRVHHSPYPIHRAGCAVCEETLISAAGVSKDEGAPIVHYSPGVDVEVFSLTE